MFVRGVAGGSRDNCKHLTRYVTAYKQPRDTQREPRELHTCVSHSKWTALHFEVFRPHPAPVERISPRTLSDFKLFSAQLQRRDFSSKSGSDSAKDSDGGGSKKKDPSKLEECINRMFAEIKKTCFGQVKEAETRACEAPPTGRPQKTSGKDECLEKSIERLKQIASSPAKAGNKAAVEIDQVGVSKAKKKCKEDTPTPVCGKDPPQAVEKDKQAKKICSRASPLPLSASKRQTIEKGAVPERETCKKDTPPKQERPICGKDPPQAVEKDKQAKKICSRASPLPLDARKSEAKEKGAVPERETCNKDTPPKKTRPICGREAPRTDGHAHCNSKITPKKSERHSRPCKTTETKREQVPEDVFADRRCVQDGDTPTEKTQQKTSCGDKGKRDPCKKHREKWQQKTAAACPPHVSKRDTPPEPERGVACEGKGGVAEKDASRGCGVGKRTGRERTKDDRNKFEQCVPILPKNEEAGRHNKCESTDDVGQIARGVLGHTNTCLSQRTPDVKAEPHRVCPEYDEGEDDTVVEARIPPCDIMKILGRFLDRRGEDELNAYYGDSYPNHTYYMYTREFFYDVNAKLQACRQPQPHPKTSGGDTCDD